MNLTVYTCRDGSYLVVPAIMTPPLNAEQAYGPLMRGKLIESADYLLPDAWTPILEMIDAHGFAVLHPVIGQHLLGLDPEQELSHA